MQYTLDAEYKWPTLLLRVKETYRCGDMQAVVRLLQAGIELKGVDVAAGSLRVTAPQVELTVPDEAQRGTQKSKRKAEWLVKFCRYIDSIDRTGDIDQDELAKLFTGPDGVARKPKPPFTPAPPPAQQTLPLVSPSRAERELAEAMEQWRKERDDQLQQISSRVAELSQKVHNIRQTITLVLESVDKLKTGMADLHSRLPNLDQAQNDAFANFQDRLQQLEHALATHELSHRTEAVPEGEDAPSPADKKLIHSKINQHLRG